MKDTVMKTIPVVQNFLKGVHKLVSALQSLPRAPMKHVASSHEFWALYASDNTKEALKRLTLGPSSWPQASPASKPSWNSRQAALPPYLF